MFMNFCPYIEIYNEMLGRLESNGLMERWRLTFAQESKVSKFEESGPQVLTMEHLSIGFIVCSIIASKKYLHRIIKKQPILIFNAFSGSLQDFPLCFDECAEPIFL